MVKANELRIGNKVFYGNDKVIVSVTTDFLYFEKNKNPPCRPIPLTPEILEQCGFKQDNEFDDTFRLGNFDVYYRKGYCEWIVDDRGDNEGTKPRLIKYLHQLQNLYFALTNEELQVNLISSLSKS